MRKFIRFIVALLAMMVSLYTHADLTSTTVIKSGDNSSKYYRIPAIATNKDGYLVAICDKRGSSSSDLGDNKNITLVAKVSKDNGLTWSDAVEIAPNLTGGYGDAAVVYDPYISKIVCVFAAEKGFNNSTTSSYGKIYMTQSEDGVDWDTPIDITSQIAGKVSGWSGGFIASGRMLYVTGEEGTGGSIYAVADVNVNGATKSSGGKAEYEIVFRSGDHGTTWDVVNEGYLTSPVAGDGNESKLAQLEEGTGKFIMSIRSSGARRFSYSEDYGATWGTPVTSTIVEPSCNGDILNVSYNAKNYLLQSVANDASSRKNVTIYYSGDEGSTWHKGRTLCEDNAAYSALVQLSNGNIGCYVEVGDNTNGYDMVFYSMTIPDILPAQGISDNYDGTMVCNGLGYMVVPQSEDFNIDSTHPRTVTARILLNKFTEQEDKDLGVLSTRWHEPIESTETEHQYDGQQGFEFIAGKNASESFGANVSVKGDASGNFRGVLYNSYNSGIIASRWGHIAMVFDAGSDGSVKIYVDGVLVEKQTNSKRGNTMSGATIEMLHDMLIGNRYEPLTTDTLTVTTTTSNNNGRFGAPGGFGGQGGPGGNNNSGGGNDNNSGSNNNNSGTTTTTTTTTYYTYEMSPSTDRIFNSNIDDVRFYAEALSEEDVIKDRDWRFPILTKDEGLIAAYDFANMELNDEGSAFVFSDIAGNGHDGETVGVDGYAFPEVLHNISVTPLEPKEGGTLTVTRFDKGDEITLNTGEVYNASKNQDFRATAEAEEGWVLVGIFVNGVEVPSNGFFKTGKDAKIKAIFRRETDKEYFYLVSDDFFNWSDADATRYQFEESSEKGVYYLNNTEQVFPGKMQGTFHVERIVVPSGLAAAGPEDEVDPENVILAMFPTDAGTYSSSAKCSLQVMSNRVAYNIVNRLDDSSSAARVRSYAESGNNYTLFSVHPDGLTDGNHYIENPIVILTYNPDTSTQTLELIYESTQVTGVSDIFATDIVEGPIYNMQGVQVSSLNLAPGIYLKREGDKLKKIAIR
jgi:sialidase-1